MSTVTSSARIVETPAGHFRLRYADGMQSHGRDSHTDTARRWGTLPDALHQITDLVASPVWPDGESMRRDPETGRDVRPDVTVNGVTYSGDLYYVSRGYHIGDGHGDNGWSVSYGSDGDAYGHYWQGASLQRYSDSKGWQSMSDAALRKLSGYLQDTAAEMLADTAGLRDYWRGRFESSAGYAVADAKRSVESANAFLALAGEYGSTVAPASVTYAPELLS